MGVVVVGVVAVLGLLAAVSESANPNYSYHVKIDDPAHANFQEKAETRKGPDAVGYYSVLEPNGALRSVAYTADDRGFNPTVTYSYGGTSVYHQYAPAFVQDKRVQIVDKFTGPPPAIAVQPFALPQPSYQVHAQQAVAVSAPLVVPAPVRESPAPHLIAQAQGVEYAPAYMPPVSAFQGYSYPVPQAPLAYPAPVQQIQEVAVNTYLPPAPVPQAVPVPVNTYLPAPQPEVQVQGYSYAPPPKQVAVVQNTYLPPQPQVLLQKPSLLYSVPKKSSQLQILSVEKAPVKLVESDSYAVPPRNTVTNFNAPVYPDAIKPAVAVQVVEKLKNTYGPPSHVPGKPLATLTEVRRPVKVHVTVAAPPPEIVKEVKVVQPQPQIVEYQQYAPQVQYVQPAPVKVVQQQQVYQPVAVAQKVVSAPALGLYAGAIGYHTQTAGPSSYLHSYGTQGFQVTSSRNYGKIAYTQPAPAAVAIPAPQPVYAPQYAAPAPVTVSQEYGVPAPQPQAVAVSTPVQQYAQYAAPIQEYGVPQYSSAQYAVPVPAPAPQVSYTQYAQQPVYAPQYAAPEPAVATPVEYGVPARQYGVPVAAPAKLLSPAPAPVVAISAKKQNPLTFAYSYDQGAAKVSHSYSGSGW